LVLLTLGHAVVDSYGGSFLSPLLPLFQRKFALSRSRVGLMMSLLSFSASLCQPLYGALSDRFRRPWLAILGPALAAGFIGAVGLAPRYSLLLGLMLLGGAGIAAYHPAGVVLASQASGRRKGLGVSIFVTGGAAGYATAPLLSQFLIQRVGLERSFVAGVAGLLMSLLLWIQLRRVTAPPRPPHATSAGRELGAVWKPLLLLNLISATRAAVSVGLTTFLPLYLDELGRGSLIGQATSLLLYGGTVGGLLGGAASDRLGHRRVVLLSGLIGCIVMGAAAFAPGWGLTWVDSAWHPARPPAALSVPLQAEAHSLPPPTAALWSIVALFALGSLALQAAIPAGVVMAQELAPQNAGTVSSLMTGFSWGVGSFLAPLIGKLADLRGLLVAFQIIATLPLFTALCAFFLPRTPEGSPPPP